MARWITVCAAAGCIALAGAASAQDDVDEPNWTPTVSGPPEAISVTVPEALAEFDGSTPVDIPFEIDQPATVYAAVYTSGYNPPAVPWKPDGRWDNDAQEWVDGTEGAIARGENTNIDVMVWRTPQDGVHFGAGSHAITWPGTNMDGDAVAAGEYQFYLIVRGDNTRTVARVANDAWSDWSIDWRKDPPEVWAPYGRRGFEERVIIRSFIGTDYAASPDAYEQFDASDYMRAVNDAGGEPDAILQANGIQLDPTAENTVYVTMFSGPSTGVHKLLMKDDGTVEPVTEWGDNGHFPLPSRVYNCHWYDDAIWVDSWNRTDFTSSVIKLDPTTGEVLHAIDLGDVFTGVNIDAEGNEVPWSNGPVDSGLNPRGVAAVTHFNPWIPFVSHDSEVLWINDNGDGWSDTIDWDHDNDPETRNELVMRRASQNINAGPYGMFFTGPNGDQGVFSQYIGLVIGPDGNGLARLKVDGANNFTYGGIQYHEFGNNYDGFYDSMGFDHIFDRQQIARNEWDSEEQPGWLVHTPGAIRRGVIGGEATAVVEEQRDGLPGEFSLGDNYPNPFNPMTTLGFEIPQRSEVVLTVYNTAGQEVVRLADGEVMNAGFYTATWDGRDASGRPVSSGVYLYQMRAGSYTDTKRMSLLK